MKKNIWKSLLILIANLCSAYASLVLSGKINDIFGHSGNLISLIAMAIPFMCIMTIVFKYIVEKVFKEDLEAITSKSSVMYLVVCLIAVSFIVISLYRVLKPSGTDFSLPPLDMIVWIMYLLLPIAIGISGLVFVAITFLMIRISTRHPRYMCFIGIISLVIWWVSIQEGGSPLESIARPSSSYYQTTNWYFMWGDRVYAYGRNGGGDVFYHISIEGNDKEILSTSDDMRFAKFFLVKDNHAYYYTEYRNKINKVDLVQGEIDEVYQGILGMLPDTLEDNRVLAGYRYGMDHDRPHAYIGWLNLESGNMENEKKLGLSNYAYHYAKINDTVYYIVEDEHEYHVYGNDEILFKTENEIYSVFKQNNFLYIISEDSIIQFGLEDYQLVNKVEGSDFPRGSILNNPNSSMINLGTSIRGYNFFYDYDYNLYVFNDEEMLFEWIMNFDIVKHASSYKDYVLFRSKEQVVLHHPKRQTQEIYSNVMHYSIQGDTLYLLVIDGERYSFEKDARFYVQKIE